MRSVPPQADQLVGVDDRRVPDPGGIIFRRRRAIGPVTDPKRSPDFDVRLGGMNVMRRRLVAAGLALGIVHSDMVQFSGVAPIMIYSAERDEVVTISGLGWWPKASDITRSGVTLLRRSLANQ